MCCCNEYIADNTLQKDEHMMARNNSCVNNLDLFLK